jgi:hypothetical protein
VPEEPTEVEQTGEEDEVPGISIGPHFCNDDECGLICLRMHGARIEEIDGKMVPSVELDPVDILELIQALAGAAQGRLFAILNE